MAPPTAKKPKSANPAPDYTVLINRIQSELEGTLRAVRSFTTTTAVPATTPTGAVTATKATTTSPPITTTPPTTTTTTAHLQARARATAENLFREASAQDPEAGAGFSSTAAKTTTADRETQKLQRRFLGRGGRNDQDGNAPGRRRGAYESSSDEEAGRSGLGRAKKEKKSNIHVDGVKEEDQRPVAPSSSELADENAKEGGEGILPIIDDVDSANTSSEPSRVVASGKKRKAELDEDEEEEEDGGVSDEQPRISGEAADGHIDVANEPGQKRKKKKKKNKKRNKVSTGPAVDT